MTGGEDDGEIGVALTQEPVDLGAGNVRQADVDDGQFHNTPLVLGTASPPSRLTAWRNARPNALKQASVL